MNLIEFGDCRDTMRRWVEKGIKAQMCVTSPPYFGLRDYGHPGQLGLEKTPAEYVAALVEVFGLVRELLADDGVLWLNLGDSYSNGGRKTRDPGQSKLHPAFTGEDNAVTTFRPDDGAKPKDLLGIPWRVAFALQADGWYLRQDIIWHKPNPMPESVRDRCTKAHEYIFLLSKSDRYFFDSDAMKEPAVCDRMRGPALHPDTKSTNGNSGLSRREPQPFRNRRSVWTVATRPYNGAHFATFPPELIEPCILAGSRPDDIVLDPFMGSGTTAEVSILLGRQYLGCELNAEYHLLQQERIAAATETVTAEKAQGDLFIAADQCGATA